MTYVLSRCVRHDATCVGPVCDLCVIYVVDGTCEGHMYGLWMFSVKCIWSMYNLHEIYVWIICYIACIRLVKDLNVCSLKYLHMYIY